MAGVLAFQRRRRKMPVRAQWREYKTRLPRWLKLTEGVLIVGFWIAGAICLPIAAIVWHHERLRDAASGDPNADGLIAIPLLFAWLLPAMLLANGVSWLVAPMRRANLKAMAGLNEVSFGRAMRELLIGAAFFVPYCLVFAALGLFEPWSPSADAYCDGCDKRVNSSFQLASAAGEFASGA